MTLLRCLVDQHSSEASLPRLNPCDDIALRKKARISGPRPSLRTPSMPPGHASICQFVPSRCNLVGWVGPSTGSHRTPIWSTLRC